MAWGWGRPLRLCCLGGVQACQPRGQCRDVWAALGSGVTLLSLSLSLSPVSALCCLQSAPDGAFASADALLSRLARPTSLCGALDCLEPDLAEKNPPVFAQKLQVRSPCGTSGESEDTSVEREAPMSGRKAGFVRSCCRCRSGLSPPTQMTCVVPSVCVTMCQPHQVI